MGGGGSRIGDAIRRAVDAFGPSRGLPRAIILITDGEDHDSYPIEAVNQSVEKGIRIVSVGFGSEEGSQITIINPKTNLPQLVKDAEGNPVVSRLDGDLLREIAQKSQGVYIPAGTSNLDLDQIIESHLRPLILKSETVQEQRKNPKDYYHYLVLTAAAALFLFIWLSKLPSGAKREGVIN